MPNLSNSRTRKPEPPTRASGEAASKPHTEHELQGGSSSPEVRKAPRSYANRLMRREPSMSAKRHSQARVAAMHLRRNDDGSGTELDGRKWLCSLRFPRNPKHDRHAPPGRLTSTCPPAASTKPSSSR